MPQFDDERQVDVSEGAIKGGERACSSASKESKKASKCYLAVGEPAFKRSDWTTCMKRYDIRDQRVNVDRC